MTSIEVRPPNVRLVAPREIFVVPIVTLELVRLALEMLLSVLLLPLIVLLVSVSVVARPTSVSVVAGRVRVPELEIDAMTGVVSVLLVSVCVPVSVTTDAPIPMVTADEPS